MPSTWTSLGLALTSASLVMGGSAIAAVPVQVFETTITEEEVLAAGKNWCAALVGISNTFHSEGAAAAKAKAEAVIDAAYGFQQGPVAFKPTLASGESTFRNTRQGALDYFVGPDPAFPPGRGFATYKRWTDCTVKEDVIQLFGPVANSMGNVSITDDQGNVTTVDKTWTFWQPKNDVMRIVLHHSSIPFEIPQE
ncbi:MAG: hypothetical protein ACPG22_01625 [Prochlorococcaceae cyanobacterium]|nr:hypothetical protein [Synechococcus sp.]